MAKVVLVASGGTIASRTTAGAGLRAVDGANDLLSVAQLPDGVDVVGVDVEQVNSFDLTPARMATLVARALAGLTDPSVDGVVITHGTDTLEATALMAQLVHADPRPIVLTGAMRPADADDADGPRNLGQAVTVAASPAARGLGVLVCFDAHVFAGVGARKSHTTAPAAFTAPDAGAVGHVVGDRLLVLAGSEPALAERLLATGLLGRTLGADLPWPRVDVVASYPGADGVLLRAAVAAGASGVVLAGTGAGNATSATAHAVGELTAVGIVVALTTQVHAGPVTPVYGGGGGHDLVAAGAVPLTWLRPQQALVLLSALLATTDPQRARTALARW